MSLCLNPIAVIAAAVLCATGGTARALEPIVLYDNFDAAEIDPAKWPGNTERVKQIVNGKLRMLSVDYGGTDSDAGSLAASWNHAFPDPAALTEMRAKVVVNGYRSVGCTTNATVTQARVRLIGTFFNTGVPIPGNQTGDVIAQMRVTRLSNSQDAANMVRVDASLLRCNDATCSSQTLYDAPPPDFGPLEVGKPVTLQIQWDKANKSFLFRRDTGVPYRIEYADDDSHPPSTDYKHLRITGTVPNCTTLPRPTSAMDVTFDGFSVNESAAP